MTPALAVPSAGQSIAGCRQGLSKLFRELVVHEGDTGVLNLKGQSSAGALFVEKGRVCWVAAPETRRYLRTQLLSTGLDADLLERRLAEANARRVPLGELLVSEGVLTAHALREAILEHSVESLRHVLSKRLVDVTFSARASKSFDSMFTFDGVHIVGEAAKRLSAVPAEAWRGPPPQDVDGFVMVGQGDTAFPIARLGDAALPLGHADALGKRALRVLQALPAGAARPSGCAVSFRKDGMSWSVCGTPRCFVVSVASSTSGFSWMLTDAGLPFAPQACA